jgi:hypothetical protein
VTLNARLSGTDRIFPFTSSSRSRLPVLLALIKRGYRKSYGVRRPGRLRHDLRPSCGTRSARQVRVEDRPMAGKESAASQEKSGGPQEARASVSFGSAGAGEEKRTALFHMNALHSVTRREYISQFPEYMSSYRI